VTHGDIQVEVVLERGSRLATVRGALDLDSADVLARHLTNVADDEDLVVDLSEIDFMDSSGLAVILRESMRRRAAGGSLHIRRPSDPVRRLLEFCCLEHLIEPTKEPARLFRRWSTRGSTG
jgi:anti-anti-sigma factor